jgi:hypothetical protein
MLRRAVIAGVLALPLLAGCGTSTRKVWHQAGATEMQFRRDRYDCDRENRWVAGGSGLPGTLAILEAKAQAEDGFRECMELRGWTLREEEQ